jgi:hypothetical protein
LHKKPLAVGCSSIWYGKTERPDFPAAARLLGQEEDGMESGQALLIVPDLQPLAKLEMQIKEQKASVRHRVLMPLGRKSLVLESTRSELQGTERRLLLVRYFSHNL